MIGSITLRRLAGALLLAGLAGGATAQQTNLPAGVDALRGRQWSGAECCGWTWGWVQQSGPQFRGEFRNPNGQRLDEPNITISISGEQVTIIRAGGSPAGGCTYTGTIRVGRAWGTYSCAGRPAGNWSASISQAVTMR
jgi:hypothetical protein